MSTDRGGRVLVATSGSAASAAAITRAAREAAARGTSLELVHVAPPVLAVEAYAASVDPAVRQAGCAVLADGEKLARGIAPQIDVVTTLLTGSRAEAVVDHADTADLLVVGAPPRDLMGRLWTGSTVMGIAARARCPVLIASAQEAPDRAPEILVGLKSTRQCEHLLATAFATARQTQSDVRIVHAWHMISPYDEVVAEGLSTPEWEREELRAIEGVLIDLRMAYPDVQVRIALVHGQPAQILLHAAQSAGLLVISRPAHGGFAHHLGATARAVIRGSSCPVLVVPPHDVAAEGGGARHDETARMS
jgi:nucleotide-binding universal stress UspA family protein